MWGLFIVFIRILGPILYLAVGRRGAERRRPRRVGSSVSGLTNSSAAAAASSRSTAWTSTCPPARFSGCWAERRGQDDHSPADHRPGRAPPRVRPRRWRRRGPGRAGRARADRRPRPGPALLRLDDRASGRIRGAAPGTGCGHRPARAGETLARSGSRRGAAEGRRYSGGCVSGLGSPRRWSRDRGCSSSTSRSARSIPKGGGTCSL